MTREQEARERVMEALDAWSEDVDTRPSSVLRPSDHDLIDAYAALKRAQNGEPEND
jgi:hypothetical protein